MIQDYLSAEQLEETRNQMRRSNGFREPNEEFNELGLRFDLDYLNMIGGGIIMIPFDKMMEYVDLITKTAIDFGDVGFENDIINISDNQIPEILKNLDATGIGNFAYIYMNCKNAIAKSVAKVILEKYQKYYLEYTKIAFENLVKISTGTAKEMAIEGLNILNQDLERLQEYMQKDQPN